MKKKSIFLMLLLLMLMIPTFVFAFVEDVGNQIEPTPVDGMADMASTILSAIQWVGYAIAFGMLLYIGIKYMMSAASEKAALKQSVINYLIGAFVVVTVTTIFPIIVGLFEGNAGGNDGYATDDEKAQNMMDIWQNGNVGDIGVGLSEIEQAKQKLQQYNNSLVYNKTTCSENKNGAHEFVVESIVGDMFLYKCIACNEGLTLHK